MGFINANNLNKRILVVKDRQYDPQTGELSQLVVEINRPDDNQSSEGTLMKAETFNNAINSLIVEKITSDREKVNNDKEALVLNNELTEDSILPVEGNNGSTITWESTNPNVIVDNGSLFLSTTSTCEETNLLATITFDTIQKVKIFTVTVSK